MIAEKLNFTDEEYEAYQIANQKPWVKQIQPESSDKPLGGRLESWLVSGVQVKGYLRDDPMNRWKDDSFITTSYVVELNEEEGYLETRNTRYDLGEKFIFPSDEEEILN